MGYLKIISSHLVIEKLNSVVDDSSKIFAIEAKDGTKGTLVISDGAKHFRNSEVIENLKKSFGIK